MSEKNPKKKTNSEARPPILGKLYDATSDGFLAFIAEANVMEASGYSLFTFVRLEKKLAAVFKQAEPAGREYTSMFDDDEDEVEIIPG